jgi:hypothetical protein
MKNNKGNKPKIISVNSTVKLEESLIYLQELHFFCIFFTFQNFL